VTGVPTQLTIADLVLENLRNSGEAVPGDNELPFFYLGAIAPALADFLPTRIEDGTGGSNAPLVGVWFPILGLLAGTPTAPGLATNLRTLKNTLRRFSEAVADQDKFEILGMKADLEALPGIITAVRGQLAAITGIRTAMPMAIAATRPRPKVPPTGDRHPRDAVHGHRTGAFWSALRRRSAESGDPRLQAFGLGVSIGYAGALCGNPFVNGVVGAPYRNHWWRHRWVSQYVDSWVWGYYRTRERVRQSGQEIVFTSNGRVPIPPYPAWDNIPGAELQNRFAIGGINPDAVLNAVRDGVAVAAHLPNELVTLWLEAFAEAVGDPPSPGVDAAGLQGAYAMTWLTTWIASSESFLGATAPDRINEPDDCGERPAWVAPDGGVVTGGTLTPPPPVSQPSPSVAEVASAIAAAILGVVSFILGGAAAGIVLIIAAVATIDEATDPDWDELRCHAGWVDGFVVRLENAFRDLLAIAGLSPPYAVQLAHNEIQFSTFQDIVPWTAALRMCRSPSADEGDDYPASVWTPSGATGSNWTQYPTEPLEPSRQISYAEGSWWPRHFVDGFSFVDNGPTAVPRFTATQDNPLDAPGGTPSVLDSNEWELRMQRAELGGIPQGAFGNAVDVALTLIRTPQDDLLDWDLDGDRGIGWPTWVWNDPTGQPGDVIRQ
jgi:hypothetical protein